MSQANCLALQPWMPLSMGPQPQPEWRLPQRQPLEWRQQRRQRAARQGKRRWSGPKTSWTKSPSTQVRWNSNRAQHFDLLQLVR